MKFAACLRLLALTAALLGGPAPRAAALPWPDVPYTYLANQAPLERVLADFAASFGVPLVVDPGVQGIVDGHFSTANPALFVSKLAGMYGFVWYTYSGTLFVSRASDIITRSVSAPDGNVGDLRKALASLGVLQPSFGWGELANQGVAMISGPPSYVHLIESTIQNLPARAQQARMFRLKYASAFDRTVNYRGQTLTTPGLATVLRQMISGSGFAASVAPSDQGVSSPLPSMTPLGESGAGSLRGAAPAAAPEFESRRKGPQPTVVAEPRLNAIIVQDVPERMPLYAELIEQLDLPTSLVDIEAMIIDVSTDRAVDLGVDWSGVTSTLDFGFGLPASALVSDAVATVVKGSTSGSYFLGRLHLLETNGEAEVQSRPSVLTSENLEALVDLSTTFYIKTTGQQVANVTPVTAGTTLRVTPHVFEQGGRTLIDMKIDIQDGEVAGQTIDGLPTVTNSTVSTQATVRQGQALLIAGHSYSRDVKAGQQLPLLGDIPILGYLFADRTHTVQKRERMFLIRPRVIALAGPSAADTLPEPAATAAPSPGASASPQMPRAVSAPAPLASTSAPVACPAPPPTYMDGSAPEPAPTLRLRCN